MSSHSFNLVLFQGLSANSRLSLGGWGSGMAAMGRTLHRMLRGAAGLVGAVALLCVVWSRGPGRAELEVFPVRGGGEFGFQPNEAGVSPKEQVDAMAGLISASGGGEVLSAAGAQEDQRRWLAPYFARKAEAMRKRFGDGPIPSAVNLDSQAVPLRTVSPRRTSFERHALGGSLPVDTAVDGLEGSTSRAKAKMQLLEEAYSGPDHFSPQVPPYTCFSLRACTLHPHLFVSSAHRNSSPQIHPTPGG